MSTAPASIPTTPPAPVSFWEAFRYWLKLGFISFGGPAGQISMMHQELVEKRRWISEHRFLHALNYCMVLPGPEAIQLAIYIGWLMHGVLGGIVAGRPVLPAGTGAAHQPVVDLYCFRRSAGGGGRALRHQAGGHRDRGVCRLSHRFQGAKKRGAVGARRRCLRCHFCLRRAVPRDRAGRGDSRAIGGRLLPDKFKAGGGHGASNKAYGPALIDDNTPVPDHARFSWVRITTFLGVGLALGIGVFGILLASYGWQGTLTQMGWFFTKAAFLTIGGAYAVLPYVYQGVSSSTAGSPARR